MSNTRNICNYLTQKVTELKDTLHLKPDEANKFILPVAIFAVGGAIFSLPSAAVALFTYSTLPGNMFSAIVLGSVVGAAHVAYGRANNEQASDIKVELPERKDVALIKIEGDISLELSDKVMPLLKKAFTDQNIKGIVLRINSGGGSPVQSKKIHDEILKLKKQYQKRIVAVGEDRLTGGAYYIACGADTIYVNELTRTGSIGVTFREVGVAELAKKVGIEPRIHTSSPYKNRSELLLTETKEDGLKTDKTLQSILKNFITAVKASRENRLKTSEDIIFSGDSWLGEEALEYGLVDKLGSYIDVLQKEFFVDQTVEYDSRGIIERFFNRPIQPKIDFSLKADDQSFGLRM